MVHVHARMEDGQPTHEIDRIQAVYDAIKQKSPDLLVCLAPLWAISQRRRNSAWPRLSPSNRKMASYNTNR